MNDNMRLSRKGAKFVQSFEGYFPKAYLDPIGVLTIGWGHTNHHEPKFSAGEVWSREKCEEVFRKDMRIFEDAVIRNVRVPLTQGQFDALVSFTYNCGEGNLRKSSLLRRLNAGDYEGAAAQFAYWNKAGGRVLPGLTRRRTAEALMFRDTSLSVSPRADEPMAQEVDDPKPSLFKSKIVQTATTVGVADAASTLQSAADAKGAVKDLGFWDQLIHIMSMPSVWAGIAILVAVGAIIYWRWRDH
jgi:lysozyme